MPMEQRGVDTIPEEERTSSPRDLVSILLGSNLCLGVIVFGWLPVSFGLGLWPAVTSIVAGTVVGVAVTAPLALVSLRTATNLSTSSGAAFGVRGRLIGSVVGLLLSLGYTALTLWIGGDVMLGTLSRHRRGADRRSRAHPRLRPARRLHRGRRGLRLPAAAAHEPDPRRRDDRSPAARL